MSEVYSHPSAADGPSEIGKASSGRRGRRRGVEIKPGTVKQARADAGLSLGQVAGGELSRTAIYFVETGKAKPSIETLKLIAERTGRPLDYFLTKPSTMEPRSTAGTAEMERLTTAGDAAGALAAGEALFEVERDPEIWARIKFLMATAHLRLAQPVQARRLASGARAYFEQAGDLLMVAECLGSEASAAYLMQDPGALTLAEGALATCRSLKPVPGITEARLLVILAGVHVTDHNWQGAIDAYQQAIEAGDVVQDLRRLSLTYSGLSLAYQESGQLNQAAHYAQRAMAIHDTLNDRISLARSENNLGLMLLRAGDRAKARGHLERALRLSDETGLEAGKSHVLLSLSELAVAESRLDEAARFANTALDLATRLSEGATVAEAHMWLGRIAAARDAHRAADAEFAVAFDVLASLGSPAERSSRAHADYAEILEARGDMAGAVQHLKQALAARPSQRAVDSKAAIA
jgi:tetratricopeptide (TPR) repeat protein/DNA-binding XRE family transcriptional regulator